MSSLPRRLSDKSSKVSKLGLRGWRDGSRNLEGWSFGSLESPGLGQRKKPGTRKKIGDTELFLQSRRVRAMAGKHLAGGCICGFWGRTTQRIFSGCWGAMPTRSNTGGPYESSHAQEYRCTAGVSSQSKLRQETTEANCYYGAGWRLGRGGVESSCAPTS